MFIQLSAICFLALLSPSKAEGVNVELICHGLDADGSENGFSSIQGTNQLEVTCSSGTFVDQHHQIVDISELTCAFENTPTMLLTKNSACSATGADGRLEDLSSLTLVKIGWELQNQFLDQITICVDEKLDGTTWTSHVVEGPGIEQRDIGGTRPSFQKDLPGFDRFFMEYSSKTAVNNVYKIASQQANIGNLLGTDLLPNGAKIIDDSSSNYFARGHLSPDAAFVYKAQQDATYFFINVAPQFQAFNNGNWKALEGSVRQYAAENKARITVYTGTFDILKYPSSTGEMKEIFLEDQNGEHLIPVPKYFWKIVHNKQQNQAIAFIGHNDIHLESEPEKLCEDRCSNITWADWTMTQLSSGFMYCCQVQELRETIANIPDLSDESGEWPDILADVTPEVEQSFPQGSCIINLEKWAKTHEPILVQDQDFLYPRTSNWTSGDRLVVIENAGQFSLLCHGSEYNPSFLSSTQDQSEMVLACQDGVIRTLDGSSLDVTDVECSSIQEPFIQFEENVGCATESLNGRSLSPGYTMLIKVGWNMPTFQEQYRVCMDTKIDASLWTHHRVDGRSIEFRDIDSGRPSFRRDIRDFPSQRFFKQFTTNTALANSYTKTSQLNMILEILETNVAPDGKEIIETSSHGTSYFAKGHLSPDAAFVYNVQQDATYYFFNVAPQYQGFNNGNWKALEGAVRDYAAKCGNVIDVYTGTYGNLKMPNSEGKSKNLYLALIEGVKLLDPPKYYWKVIHNKDTNEAIAFVGVNNPHSESKPSYMCSPSVCDRLSWVDWKTNSFGSGYMYCCNVQELRTTIEYVPDLSDELGNWPDLMSDQ